jgi:hypothetical protein
MWRRAAWYILSDVLEEEMNMFMATDVKRKR